MSTFLTQVLAAITGAFTTLGDAIFEFIRNGFVKLFCEVATTADSANDIAVGDVIGISEVGYFAFILMGLTLCLSLTKYVTSILRAKRSM